MNRLLMLIFLTSCSFSSAVFGSERPKAMMSEEIPENDSSDKPQSARLVAVDNSHEISIKDSLKSLADSFNEENLASYESFFKESRRKYIRRKAGLVFASNDCSMELLDSHVLDVSDGDALVAVKYRIGNDSGTFEVVSEIFMVQESGRWLVSREKIKAQARSSKRSSSSSRGLAVVNANNPNWDDFNPNPDRIPETLHHLMGDIGIQEGFGCADGRCNR